MRERKRLKFNPPPPFQSGYARWLSYPRSELAEILEPRVHKKNKYEKPDGNKQPIHLHLRIRGIHLECEW
jgi:hypothetical protein